MLQSPSKDFDKPSIVAATPRLQPSTTRPVAKALKTTVPRKNKKKKKPVTMSEQQRKKAPVSKYEHSELVTYLYKNKYRLDKDFKEKITKWLSISNITSKKCPVAYHELIYLVKEILRRAYDKPELSVNEKTFLENVAFSIGTWNIKNPKDVGYLLKAFSLVQPTSIPLLSGIDILSGTLVNDLDYKLFSIKDLIDIAYGLAQTPRPITANVKDALGKIVNYLATEHDINALATRGSIARFVKVLSFVKLCLPDFNVDETFKTNLRAYLNKHYAAINLESTPEHMAFSGRLKQMLQSRGIIVKDEYFSELVGTHIDIVIESHKIAIEINGPKHYFSDKKTEEPETKFKRELLEASGWHVISVRNCDIARENQIDDIIREKILPIIDKEKKDIASKLLEEVNAHFLVKFNPDSKKPKTASKFLGTISSVEFLPKDAATPSYSWK